MELEINNERLIMNHKTINNIDCYGSARLGSNYEITFDDEILDFIATGVEATSWTQVLQQLAPLKGIQQIISC
jgi:hypothetical protein